MTVYNSIINIVAVFIAAFYDNFILNFMIYNSLKYSCHKSYKLPPALSISANASLEVSMKSYTKDISSRRQKATFEIVLKSYLVEFSAY